MAPDALSQVLSQLPKQSHPNLLVGFDTSDDASVYKIDDDKAIIQTVDIFPPVVDDPFSYGQIAAANSLSDVYAMGGTPTLAMNILCLPEELDDDVAHQILLGGYSKCEEAGALLCGGHTIVDKEPKYGLCVTGFVHPDKIFKNDTSQVGDKLIITKAVGSGILNTAIKGNLLEQEEIDALIKSMATLNKSACDVALKYQINSCTDITGFGLLGHTYEMAKGSGNTIKIFSEAVPLLPKVYEMASMGIVPAGAYKNRNWLSCQVSIESDVDEARVDSFFDPQTSGGLLLSVKEEESAQILNELKEQGLDAAIIGEVCEFNHHFIEVVK